MTLVPVDPFYRIVFDDGTCFDYNGDAAAMRAEVAKLSPSDVDGYERFVAASEAIYKTGFEALGDVPFDAWTDMARVLPDLVRLDAWRTVHALAAKHMRDARLRVVLTFESLLVGGNPFSTTSVYCLIAFLERRWGVHFAMGGTGSLVRGLVSLIEGQGGTLRMSTRVTRILAASTRGGRPRASGVRPANGETLAADVVVSNCDSAWTYRHLVEARHRRRWTDRRLDRARYSMSLFVWYFGTSRATTTSRTTRSCSGRAIASSSPTSSIASTSPTTSASACIDRPRPTRRSRPTAAMRSTCCRRCRTSTAAPTGARWRSRIARVSRRISRSGCCPARGNARCQYQLTPWIVRDT